MPPNSWSLQPLIPAVVPFLVSPVGGHICLVLVGLRHATAVQAAGPAAELVVCARVRVEVSLQETCLHRRGVTCLVRHFHTVQTSTDCNLKILNA